MLFELFFVSYIILFLGGICLFIYPGWITKQIQKQKEKIKKEQCLKKIRLEIQQSVESDKFEQNEGKLSQIIDSGTCPDCNKWEMYNGPSGGMSTNIYCGNCGSHFNYCPGFVTGRIHQIDISGLKNSVPLSKEIIRKWRQVKLSIDQGWRDEHLKAQKWREQNCSDKWTMNSWHFYFENSADSMAFKLVWTNNT